MDTLHETQSNEIVGAVKGVISDVNNGLSPNDAFVRIVKEGKFSPEIVTRMVEAFNQSRAVKQLEESPEKRANDFELADPKIIFNEVYSSADNDCATAPLMYDSLDDINLLKQSSVSLTVYKTTEDYAESDITIGNRLLRKKASLKKQLSDIDITCAKYNRLALQNIKAAAASFKRLTHESFDDVDRRIQGAFGEKGTRINEIVYKMANVPRKVKKLQKQASFLLPNRTPYIEIQAAIGYLEKLAEAQDQKCVLEVIVAGELNNLTKESSYTLDDMLSKMQDYAPQAKKDVSLGRDAAYDNELRLLKLKANIADIVKSDPVISAYPTNDIIKATNTIVNVAPSVMSNRDTLRAALYRSLVDHNMSVDEALNYASSESDHLLKAVQSARLNDNIKG